MIIIRSVPKAVRIRKLIFPIKNLTRNSMAGFKSNQIMFADFKHTKKILIF